MIARMANLVGADPLTFDGPCAEALVMRVVAGKMTVLDQPATSVPAMKMDDLELEVCELRTPWSRLHGRSFT